MLVKWLSDFLRTEGGLGLPMGLAKRPQNQWDVPHTLRVRWSQAASRQAARVLGVWGLSQVGRVPRVQT